MTSRLILASSSPRRRELLTRLGITFDTVPAEVDETPLAGEPAWACVTRLARTKALHVSRRLPTFLTLAADTVVALDGRLFNKPADAAEARCMLAALSGRTHEVWTGVCLASEGRVRELFAVTSWVRFRRLSQGEIEEYVATGEPLDKAGAYAAQGRGRELIERIEGSVSNVIGLPVEELQVRLTRYLRERGATQVDTP